MYLIEELAPILSKVQDKTLKVIYKQRLLDLFGTDAKLLEKTLDEKINQKAQSVSSFIHKKEGSSRENTDTISIARTWDSEKLLLVLCLESEAFLKDFLDQNVISYLQTKEMTEVFNALTTKYKSEPKNFSKLIHFILNKARETHLIFKAAYPIFKESSQEDQKKIFKDCVTFLKRKQNKEEASQLLANMKINNTGDMNSLEKVFQLTKQRLNPTEKI